MTCLLTEEQTFIQKAARDFARGEFDDDQILDLMEKQQFPKKTLKTACKLDLIGLTWPESAGGQECGIMDSVLVTEELCRRDSTMGLALSFADAGAETVARFGTPEQIKALNAPLLKGKSVTALICPELGQEPGPICYRKTDDTLVLNGEASVVVNADIADFFLTVAHPEDGQGERILLLFPKDMPGIAVSELIKKLGMDMTHWNSVKFESTRVSTGTMITCDTKGVDPVNILEKNLLIKTGAMFLGMAQGAFDLALGYAKEREQFRRKIAAFQGISQKIAAMYTRLQEGRASVYSAARACDKKCVGLTDLIAAQLSAQHLAEYLTDEALQIHGGVGYMIEFPVEHFFRDVKCLRTLLGRNITRMDLISRRLIGQLN
ncbi:Acyl-CoA dehydrogenase [Desulfocicer vacuolatum DSM 3385]|uniref:Acyl-CoA dehydrogenase n=1 Tax=Desulfocicer vacuolatum DSM 3385 TaxID=1121400 RepID=A0A1W2EKC7_9BACT|nr:acyl-CoA dehydrogenase family protein [Desulfocicer vacuolatum]SMD10179.1 Acyl-CoA dehydrogenase [Desulfocicer vacuolatum DSM 3385]